MGLRISDLRPVYVLGIGLHRYQPPSETPYAELGLAAVRAALADAGIVWELVESSYVATGRLGMACGRPMLAHLGSHGRPIVQIENASASGSAALRHACIEVAAGLSDVVLAVGVDKPTDRLRHAKIGGGDHFARGAVAPVTHFALLASAYLDAGLVTAEDLALISVKNHRNGARNPFAQRQRAFSLEQVLTAAPISGTFTSLQCTPVGEGAAALILASEDAIRRHGLDGDRAVRVAASTANSEWGQLRDKQDLAITAAAMEALFEEASISPAQVDVLEVHDAFTIEELQYVEASGICKAGEYVGLLREGAFDIGGACAVSASGGLLSMGHPIGPTGLGQVAEICRQLRGEAGERQQKDARIGVAHMVGLGGVSYGHVLAI